MSIVILPRPLMHYAIVIGGYFHPGCTEYVVAFNESQFHFAVFTEKKPLDSFVLLAYSIRKIMELDRHFD